VLIMGAAGRDFHNFNCLFRDREEFEVVAFTATQIPDIEGRTYPPEIAGRLYPEGIPILPETALLETIRERQVQEVWFSYSDVSHQYLMDRGSRVLAAGADYCLASPASTMLASSKPVIAITAVRTGVGKSQTSRYFSRLLRELGHRVVAIRHPMPYGDLRRQIAQRFESYEDLDREKCTIEEREEYEPHIDNGSVVYAGIDYQRILDEAEKEADVILWDGGNNDTPFYQPDLHVTLVDPHRPGHELTYYPGAVNFRMADLLIVNKVDTAEPEPLERVLESCRLHNPRARVVQCRSAIVVDQPELIRGKRALVVEDGPTLTHGGMSYGAGWIAAKRYAAAEIIDPTEYAVGSIRETYEAYPNARRVLPAMGYGDEQIRELEATINATPAEVVVEGTPINLRRVLQTDKPIANVRYELEEVEPGGIAAAIDAALKAIR
jgi:predicted GTPase